MADVGESSSAPTSSATQRPVVVRVKRKPSQSPVEAFWLEISERPLKRALLDFEKLSLAGSSGKEETWTKRVFVKHVETVSSSDNTIDALQPFVQTGSGDGARFRANSRGRQSVRKENKQVQLLSKAKQDQEALAKSARFEQIWRSRRGNKEIVQDEELHEVCRLYDVVRVDAEETPEKSTKQETMSKEDQESLAKFLPLLRELVPDAAEDIESDLSSYALEQEEAPDGFVYDLYTVEDNAEEMDDSHPFPLVQVDDNEWDDGLDDSDYETDDSNAENHHLNDYPDEESDEEVESETATDESEEEEDDSGSRELSEDEHPKHLAMSDDDMDDDNLGHGFDDDDADSEDF